MKLPVKFKVPDKHTIVHKGESFFHGSYLAVESGIGHGPLQLLAAGALLCVIANLFIHWLGD